MLMKAHCRAPLLFAFLVLTITPVKLMSQGFRILHEFAGPDAASPQSGLILVTNTLFGAASSGGSGGGALFSVNTNGTGFTIVYTFPGGSGANPEGTLALSENVFYGTCEEHVNPYGDYGSVFSVNMDGTGYTPIYTFAGGDDGAQPDGVVILGGMLYTVTRSGGSFGLGTVSVVGITTLYNFSGPDGANPYGALAINGDALFGVTRAGGSTGNGTVFAINADGSGFITLHTFMGTANAEGAHPTGGMILSGSVLYGTTFFGGASGNGTVFRLNTDGSGFRTLHSFGGADGANPQGALTLSGNTLYGTTYEGGNMNNGTVFELRTDGSAFVTLHAFGGSDGFGPSTGLVLSDNTLYGTTAYGGSSGGGILFSLQKPVAAPVLTIIRSGPNVILTWLPDGGPFTLQSATNLVAPILWSDDGPAPSVLNGLNTVTNSVSGMQRFYRLKQ